MFPVLSTVTAILTLATGQVDYNNKILYTADGEVITLKKNNVATVPFDQCYLANNYEYAKKAFETVEKDLVARSFSHNLSKDYDMPALVREGDSGNRILSTGDGEVVTMKDDKMASVPSKEPSTDKNNDKYARHAYDRFKNRSVSHSVPAPSPSKSEGATGYSSLTRKYHQLTLQSEVTEPARTDTAVYNVVFQEGPCNLVVDPQGIFEWLCLFNRPHVLVNAANKHMSHGGGIALTISRLAGRQMDIECKQQLKRRSQSLNSGDVLITDAHNLSSYQTQRIVHAVGPNSEEAQDKTREKQHQKLVRCYIQAINEANRLGLPLVTPALSTGIFGVDITISVQAFRAAVAQVKKDWEGKATQHGKTSSFPGAYMVLSRSHMEPDTIDRVQSMLGISGAAVPAAIAPLSLEAPHNRANAP